MADPTEVHSRLPLRKRAARFPRLYWLCQNRRASISKQIHAIFCFETCMAKRPQSAEKAILDRIHGHGRGWAFTPRHFLALATRAAIASALKRQTDKGHLRQLARGLYGYPKRHPKLGLLAPAPDALAKALAGRDEVRLQPSGAYAANLLGLSEQVPAKVVFLTDGASRLVRVGTMTVQLRRTTPRNMAAAGRSAGLVLQALRHLGPEHVTPARVAHLRRTLPIHERRSFAGDREVALRRDYEAMRDMYLAAPVPFVQILEQLPAVERRINGGTGS